MRHRVSPAGDPSPLCHSAQILAVTARLWIADPLGHYPPLTAMAQVGIALALDERWSHPPFPRVAWGIAEGQGSEERPGVAYGAVAHFDFGGQVRQLGISHSMAYRR
jgi:hypothetical protein